MPPPFTPCRTRCGPRCPRYTLGVLALANHGRLEDLCIGGWDGGRLGAYFILRYCGQDAHNYAAFMGIPREEWDGWANADSAIVHPDYRGNGLQRKLLEVALTLLRPGIVGIGATVSPENQYSLNNALASGFEIVCRREMYGGYDRYLLAKAPLRHLR